MSEVIFTKHAPAPIGPYSQAKLSNGTLYVSGQIAINPENGEMVNDNIVEETNQVMKNLKAVLEAADMNFEHVLKCTIFVADLNNFKTINEVYGSYFDAEQAPARETVEVARLPKDVNVEISAIAVK
ncbi:MAG: RidA family protein [Flavobacteriales bacterium]|nr:RidA family protein [Flavobacteriales bacterium]